MDEVIQILVARYSGAEGAELALKKLREANANQGIALTDAAVVRRTDEGKLEIHETEDISGKRGAAVGGILGGVLGIIAGPAGVVAGAAVGAAVGGAAASVFDTGIPHKQLETIGASLEPHHAALVILTEAGYVPFIESLLGGPELEILSEKMSSEAAQRLGQEHDRAVKAIRMGEALADGGMASPSDSE